LVATSGPHAGAVFPLITGAVVGRDPGCTLALPADTKASRRHAALSFQNGTWRIVDQNSTNGTWVNGQRVVDLALAHGDTIVVGESTLRFEG
jgi:pSer/pThr/pTyr-binding forkhead associated (FHA) protein